MPAGLAVYLDDGSTIQIDETYVNLMLIGKYQVMPDRLITMGNPNVYDVTLTITNAINPIIAISTSVPAAHIGTKYSGSSVTYTFAGYSDTPFTVYVFDDMQASPGAFGLQVFNENGKIVFDSSQKYLKVRSSVVFEDYITAKITYPTDGRSYAFVPSGFLGYFEDYHDGYEWGESFSVKSKGSVFWNMVGGELRASSQQVWVGSRSSVGITSPFNYQVKSGTIQIIDVTGY